MTKFKRDGALRESPETVRICRELTARGCKVIAVVGSMRQEEGLPDRIVWHRRWQGFVEFKAHDGKLSAIQRAQMTQLNARRPGSAWVCRMGATNEGRWQLEDEDGRLLATFPGTGEALLEALVGCTEELRKT